MTKKPVVLFLPKWYPNKFDAFDGNFIENHAIAISKFCSVAVIFVHSEPELKKKFELIETCPFQFPEIRVYFKKPSFVFKPFNQVITSIRYLKALFRAYRYYSKKYSTPTLCHVHVLARTSILALYLKWVKKIPFLISEHWSGYHAISGAYKGFLKKKLSEIAVKNTAAITVVSKNLEESMKSHSLLGNYLLIPNVVDTTIFRPNKEMEHHPKKRLIHISNLSKVPKNMHLIIDALNELAKERNDFEFIIIGTGPDEVEMLHKVNNSPLKKLTKFKGELPMEKVAEELRNSDVLLLFSLFENQPCVILEAFASGIPVISSDVGGIPEIVPSEMGSLVPSKNLQEFTAAIRNYLNGNNSFSKNLIRSHAEKLYSQKVVGQQFYELYASILKDVN